MTYDYIVYVFAYGCTVFRMNKLNVLPRGFGAFPALEVLDLTYNNLNENSLPGNFFCLSMLFIVLHTCTSNLMLRTLHSLVCSSLNCVVWCCNG